MPADAPGSRGAVDTQQGSPVFKLRLKAGCSNVQNALKQPQVIEVLSNEYVAQYLEHIGARPSRAVADLVRANAPLTAACMKAGHKAEGLADDELLLTAPSVQLETPVRPLIPKQHVEQIAAVLEATNGCAADTEHGHTISQEVTTPAVPEDEEPGTSYGFQNMSAKRMYPFNLKKTLARTQQAAKAAAAGELAGTVQLHGTAGSLQSQTQHEGAAVSADARAQAAMQRTNSSSMPGAAATGSCTGRASNPLSQDAMTELLQDFRPDFEHIVGIQEAFGQSMQQWCQGLSPGVTAGHVDAREVAATVTLLTSEDAMKLTITLLNWLYHEFVVGSASFPEHPSMHYGAKRAPALRPRPAHRGRPTSRMRAGHPEQHDLGFQMLVQQHMERSAAAAQAAATDPNTTAGTGSRHASAGSTRASHTGSQRPSGTGSACQQQVLPAGGAAGGSCPSAAGPAMPAGSRQLPAREHAGALAARAKHGPQQLASFRRLSSHSSASGASTSQGLATAAEATITASLSTPQGMKQLQQCRLVAVLQQWQQLQNELKRSRVGLFFMLPVLLLSLRALTEQLFASAFSAWLRSAHGAAAAAAMDSALLQLLDPSGYYSQMPLLQSTPAAVRLCQSFPRRWHAQELSHYSDVSTLVEAAVGEPASAEARRMLAKQGPQAHSKSSNGGNWTPRADSSANNHGGARLRLSAKLEQEGQQQLLAHTLPLKLRIGRV